VPEVKRETATAEVVRSLFADHPDKHGWMVFESISLATPEDFRSQAESWLKDRSELHSDVYDIADWNEIYGTFKNWN
jgi:hypothetical protein